MIRVVAMFGELVHGSVFMFEFLIHMTYESVVVFSPREGKDWRFGRLEGRMLLTRIIGTVRECSGMSNLALDWTEVNAWTCPLI